MEKSKGVRLIEILLVSTIVIVVAGILLSNTAHYLERNKDASVEKNLNTVLINSAIHFERNGSYTTFCLTQAYADAQASILRVNGGISGTDTRCVATTTTICMCGSLPISQKVSCVDSTGYKQDTTNNCTDACNDLGKCV